MTAMHHAPSSTGVCPVCGSLNLPIRSQSSALVAVCDLLVVKTLETVGKRIVRVDRSRYARLGDKPWFLAHTLWQPDGSMIDKALAGAWDVVPAMLTEHGCCNVTAKQVVDMLDSYVRDLLITGTGHDVTELKYRFEAILGIPVLTPGH